MAGHKGQPEKVAEAGRKPRCRGLKGARGRGTPATEKPPVLGMIQRTGEVVIRMLDNVQQATIKPLVLQTIVPGTPNLYRRIHYIIAAWRLGWLTTQDRQPFGG